jgi:hypothetical protein
VIFVLAALSAAAYAQTCGGFEDVDASDPYCAAVERIREAGIAVSYRHPDPVNNRYNNTYGPNAPMRRGAMAILLDRAFVQPPVDPLKASVGSAYRTALSKAHAYELNSSAQWRRPAEVLGFVYFYRAARKVRNLPAGVNAPGHQVLHNGLRAALT